MSTNNIVTLTSRSHGPQHEPDNAAATAKKPAIAAAVDPDTPLAESRSTVPAKTFWIAGDGSASVVTAALQTPGTNVRTFSTLEELEAIATEWPMRFLVTIWNRLPGQRPVTRFETRRRALDRLWREIQKLANHVPQSILDSATGKTEPKRPKIATPTHNTRPQSKADQLITLLRAPGGARLASLMEVTGWQAHTVRGFLSRRVSGQLGLPLQSVRRDGGRVYSLPAVDGQEVHDDKRQKEQE
jgi:hypothetical protein